MSAPSFNGNCSHISIEIPENNENQSDCGNGNAVPGNSDLRFLNNASNVSIGLSLAKEKEQNGNSYLPVVCIVNIGK